MQTTTDGSIYETTDQSNRTNLTPKNLIYFSLKITNLLFYLKEICLIVWSVRMKNLPSIVSMIIRLKLREPITAATV